MDKIIQRVFSIRLNEDELTEPLTDEQRDELETKVMQDIAKFQKEGYHSGQLFIDHKIGRTQVVELQGWFSIKEWVHNAPFVRLVKSYITRPADRDYYYFTGWGYRLNERFSFSVQLLMTKPDLDMVNSIWATIEGRMIDDIQDISQRSYTYYLTLKQRVEVSDFMRELGNPIEVFQASCYVEIGYTNLCDTLLQNAAETQITFKREK